MILTLRLRRVRLNADTDNALDERAHPTQTQRYVRMYNLAEQKLLKTLTPGIRWISSMDVHPSGDHLIVGGYDRKLCWFDLELSDKPYKILRYVFRLRSRSQTVSPCQRQCRRGSRAPSPEHALRVPLERGSSLPCAHSRTAGP